MIHSGKTLALKKIRRDVVASRLTYGCNQFSSISYNVGDICVK